MRRHGIKSIRNLAMLNAMLDIVKGYGHNIQFTALLKPFVRFLIVMTLDEKVYVL